MVYIEILLYAILFWCAVYVILNAEQVSRWVTRKFKHQSNESVQTPEIINTERVPIDNICVTSISELNQRDVDSATAQGTALFYIL